MRTPAKHAHWHSTPFVLALGAAFLLALALAGPAKADRGGNGTVTIVPAAGQGAVVRLRAQTVDITISQDEQGAWADTRVWLQFANPAAEEVTVTAVLPGPQLLGSDLPADIQLKLGEDTLAAMPGSEGGMAAQFAVPGRGEAALHLNYRQALSETHGLVTLAYPLSAAGRWGGAPESLRLTVVFAEPPAPEQILGRAPEPRTADGASISWSWDAQNASDVWLTFLSARWWRDYASARAAAAAPEARPSDHLALSHIYQELAALPRLSFDPTQDFYSRYYPAAVAELQAATRPAAGGAAAGGPEAAIAHGELAALYHTQAARLGQEAGKTYLELAASEAAAALAAGSADPALQAMMRSAYLELAADARARGDMAQADTYLARLAQAQPSAAAGAVEEQKALRLALAAEQISRGDLPAARQIISETFGAEAADIPALRPPLAGQALVSVETMVDLPVADVLQADATPLSGRRRITESLVDTHDGEALRNLLQQAEQAWRILEGVTVQSGPDWLAVEFGFRDGSQLIETQTRLAQLLPNLPELALMLAALSPDSCTLQTQETRFRRVWSYAESVDLESANANWDRRAGEVRDASLRLAGGGGAASLAAGAAISTTLPAGAGQGGTLTLAQLQRALWDANAEAWEKLAERSYAVYSVRMGESGPARQWQIPAGTHRPLLAERTDWLAERVALAGAGAALVVLLVALMLWRLL